MSALRQWSFLLVVVLGLTAGGRLAGAPPYGDQFPAGTRLVLYDDARGRAYFAAGDAVGEAESGARFHPSPDTYPSVYGNDGEILVESMLLSADAKSLLVRLVYDAFLLDAASLRPLRHFDTPWVWWEGSSLGHLSYTRGGRTYLQSGGVERRLRLGRSEVIIADATGTYFVAVRLLSEGNYSNGHTPVYRLQLWKRARRGRLQRVRDLCLAGDYEPGHSGDALWHLAARDDRLAVFGVSAWVVEELVSVLRGGRVTASLRDSKGRVLRFMHAPLVAGKEIIGLAEPLAGAPGEPTQERCVYRATDHGVVITPVSPNVVFVTYRPRRGVGYGVADGEGVSVVWGASPVPSHSAGQAQPSRDVASSRPPLQGRSQVRGPALQEEGASLALRRFSSVLPCRLNLVNDGDRQCHD
jgi:hypothetical protein